MAKAKFSAHKWEFRARFRRHAFGWKSQPAIKRIKEAVSEIKLVARGDELLAAEGAVLFLEKVSPALERVDSSSGAIGTAVNNAVAAVVDIIASAPRSARPDRWPRPARARRRSEAACRYLVKDRMDRTGACWSLEGAEAVLRLRALRASGDFDEYWHFHLASEKDRNHASRYADGEIPDPLPARKRHLRRIK